MVEMYCKESKKKVSMVCLFFIKCCGKIMFIVSIFYYWECYGIFYFF